MALGIFQTYKYHELLNKEYSLYKVSKDGISFGITNSPYVNGAIEIVPFKYENFLFFRIDRILAKYKGKYGFVSADPISPLFHGRTDLWFHNDYEIIIPFIFDSITETEKDLFEVCVSGFSFEMDIDGVITCKDIELFKRVFNPIYFNKGYDRITGIYMAECMRYEMIGDGRFCILSVAEEASDGSFVYGRGWHHLSNEDGDCDYEELAFWGVIDKEGKTIIPSIFERIEERTDIWDGYYLAKFRSYYSGTCKKLNGELYTEGNGDLYLFTREGVCVLAGFSNIVMEDENTLRVYLKDYIGKAIYTKNWKTFAEYRTDPSDKEFVAYDEYDSSYYILLNRDFKLREIPDSYSSFRNSYLEMFDSNVNPHRVPKEILQRLNIHVLPVSLVFSHYDEDREIAKDTEFNDNEYNSSIDDSLDAFDGDINDYNEWRL